MTGWVAAFVVSGVLAAVLLGLGLGFDLTAAVYLAAIAAVGFLAVRIAARFSRGTIEAGFCPHCGGTISPSAPYCKHCYEPTADPARHEPGLGKVERGRR